MPWIYLFGLNFLGTKLRGDESFDELLEIERKAKAKKPLMMKTLVSKIANGIEDYLESVNIAEIKHTDVMISVPKTEWKAGLEKAMDYYINKN